MKIADIDRNLLVPETLDLPDVKWIGAGDPRFRLYGAWTDPDQANSGSGPFRRLPPEIARDVNPGVEVLASNTAGIRLRFRTDSPYVAIHAEWGETNYFPHMPLTGTSGFDLYRIKENGPVPCPTCEKKQGPVPCPTGPVPCPTQDFVGLFTPPYGIKNGYESVLGTPGGMQDLILYFPLYNDVDRLYIGLQENAKFETPGKYSHELPVVFYGSSITQGGCASRPANAYQNMLSRGLDIDILNLGFSGSARGEKTIAEYIAKLPMLALVCDYDHNAPDPDHLKSTHYPFYQIIRDKNPELPIIIMSKPDVRHVDQNAVNLNLSRREIVKNTYEKAIAQGDNNVYFIDGYSLFEEDELQSSTVDTCHPNDLGFYYFYKALKKTLKPLIN
jgi:hypothetical protein